MKIFLHHYPESLFSEKVRVVLGYLGLSWQSVTISNVMPRPLLMPLSGGYRRTPVLQIGANVFCDTAVIVRALVREADDATLYAPGFAAHRVAAWADAHLFRLAVALNFAPEAVGSFMKRLTPAEAEAFAKDRAALSDGTPLQTVAPEAARLELRAILSELEATADDAFLFGPRPSVADFAVYHCLWFLEQNDVSRTLLEPFANVRRWMERIAAFGHGDAHDADGQDALAHAAETTPIVPALGDGALPDGLSIGDAVAVSPVDYGRVPVHGVLAAADRFELVLARETPETGGVATHFPTAGFAITPT